MKRKVLVIDDESTNLTVINGFLKHKYSVGYAKSGKEALTIIDKSKPDLILLDIMMPEMDGFELFKTLKADSDTEDIPVIFISAKGLGQAAIDAIALGAVDYIAKPIVPEMLMEKVAKHIM